MDDDEGKRRFEEPVWLMRALIVLVLVAFAAFAGQEVARVLGVYP
ncbi:MAG: hypothetical protein ACPGQL_08540 [Thermoplasmatota archaeon]